MIPLFYVNDLAKTAMEARADVVDRDTVRRYLEVKNKISTLLAPARKGGQDVETGRWSPPVLDQTAILAP